MNTVEIERADAACHPSLSKEAFRSAWDAMQNCPIDLVADSDDEQCRALGVGIAAYIEALCAKLR